MQAFTGCDTVSSFAGQGKLQALKLFENEEFQNAFTELGQQWEVSYDLFAALEACKMYAARSVITM